MNAISLNKIFSTLNSPPLPSNPALRESSTQAAALKKLPPKQEPLNWKRCAALSLGTIAATAIAIKLFSYFSGTSPEDIDTKIVNLMKAAAEEKNGSNDLTKVFHLHHKAAKLGSAEAQYFLGLSSEMPNEVLVAWKDLNDFQCDWLTQSSTQKFDLSEKAFLEKIITKDCPITEANVPLLEALADKGVLSAQQTLALLYAYGLKTEKGNWIVGPNQEKGLHYAELCAVNGDPVAQYHMGATYFYGTGRKMNFETALHWYEKSGAQGHTEALDVLFNIYYYGPRMYSSPLSIDYQKAAQYCLKGARLNDPKAQFNIAIMHLANLGVKQDLKEAVNWLEKSAEQNFAPALNRLALIYFHGHSNTSVDRVKGTDYALKSAQLGNAEGQRYLAASYFTGTGVEKNLKNALEWAEKAAAQKDFEAYAILGQLNYEGIKEGSFELPVSLEKAAAFYKLASEGGNLKYLHNSANIHVQEGTEEKIQVGIELLEAAAKSGYRPSMERLVEIYSTGRTNSCTPTLAPNPKRAAYWQTQSKALNS